MTQNGIYPNILLLGKLPIPILTQLSVRKKDQDVPPH